MKKGERLNLFERIRLEKIPDDLEIAETFTKNKKARQDAAEDMLLDEIFNTKTKKEVDHNGTQERFKVWLQTWR